jgi:hypothetical protein
MRQFEGVTYHVTMVIDSPYTAYLSIRECSKIMNSMRFIPQTCMDETLGGRRIISYLTMITVVTIASPTYP